jgi:hypothetical protein
MTFSQQLYLNSMQEGTFGKWKHGWEGSVETEPRRIVCEDVEWIKLTEDFIQQLVLVLILS